MGSGSMAGLTAHTVLVAASILPVFAILFTLFRLGIRIKDRKFGLDDSFAACAGALMIASWSLGLAQLAGTPSRSFSIFNSYFELATIYAIIWLSRLSLLSQVIRICHFTKHKQIFQGLLAIFAAMMCLLIAQLFWTCEANPAWKNFPPYQCELDQMVVVTRISFDVFGDVILVAAPVSMIRKVQTSKKHRNTLLVVFFSSVLMTIAATGHSIVIITMGGLQEILAALIDVSVALIVCNSAVIASVFLRMTGHTTAATSPVASFDPNPPFPRAVRVDLADGEAFDWKTSPDLENGLYSKEMNGTRG